MDKFEFDVKTEVRSVSFVSMVHVVHTVHTAVRTSLQEILYSTSVARLQEPVI